MNCPQNAQKMRLSHTIAAIKINCNKDCIERVNLPNSEIKDKGENCTSIRRKHKGTRNLRMSILKVFSC